MNMQVKTISADLIDAAPELLALAEELLASKSKLSDESATAIIEAMDNLANKARVVIARAKGETK